MSTDGPEGEGDCAERVAAAAAAIERRHRALAAGALIVGIALRFGGLGVHSFWFDEGATTYLATAADPLEALRSSRHPPLAIFAFRGWHALFGESDAAMRALPALLSCLSLVLFTRLAWLWTEGRARVAAVALYAVAPVPVWYAQEVTPYAFVEFGALIALVSLASAIARGKLGFAAAAGIALGAAVAFGAQYLGALVGGTVAAVAVTAWIGGRLSRGAAVGAITAAIAGGLAWLPWLTSALSAQVATAWGNEAKLGWQELAEMPTRLLLVEMSAVPPSLRFAGYALGALLILGLLLHAARALRDLRSEDFAILAALLAPIAGAFALLLVAPPNLLPRYLIAASPTMALAVASGLAGTRLRVAPWLGTAAAIAVVAGCLGVALLHKVGNRREDFRGACEEVAARWRAGDRVLVVTGMPAELEPFNEATARHYFRERADVLASVDDAAAVVAKLPDSIAPGTRVHLIARSAAYAQPSIDACLRAMRVLESRPERFRIRRYLLER